MSLGARATKGGAKAGKEGKHPPEKTKGTEKPQPKEKVKPQATTEQLRMAHMIDRKSEDASDVRRMVLELMEMTCRTEEEVCSALHDSDNDLEAACNLLLEDAQRIQGEWQTSEKKKKKPPAAAGNGEVDAAPAREPRERSGPRPRRGEGEGGRGARGRGSVRGARGARGAGRGGRRGGAPRARGARHAADWGDSNHTADGGNMGDTFPATEDWDNEEWSGSLSDTKVFTPSSGAAQAAGAAPAQAAAEDWDSPPANGPTADHIPTYTYHNAHHTIIDQINSANNHTAAAVAAVASATQPAASAKEDTFHAHHHQPMGMSGSLSAAQSQYLSSLTAAAQRHEHTYHYPAYHDGRKQRARLPPPSKIPSSAVEMPGGGESSSAMFLDVQFGALSPDTLDAGQPHEEDAHPAHSHTLSSPLPAADGAATNSAEQPVTNNTTTLEKQLSACMKQLSVSAADAPPAPHGKPGRAKPAVAPQQPPPAQPAPLQPPAQPQPPQQQQQQQQAQQQQQQPQQQQQQNVYTPHHAHLPPVYGTNVYAPQVNSTNPSLTAASAMSTYPSSVTLTQYQPMINSYQPGASVCAAQTTNAAASAAGAYSALYTSGTAYYQPPPHKPQYDTSSVASSNSLTSTSTTQTSTAKVATTTAHNTATASSTSVGIGSAGYAAALYGAAGTAAYPYDDQLLSRGNTLPHHMGGYYEVGYGPGGARDAGFGLGAGDRFGRADAASPQQVPAALPPGYAYFYQPPPSTYQYGVYPYSGNAVSAPKVSSYAQQQPYDQDSYSKGGPYTGGSNKTAAAGTELSNAMYKTHVALNKVNSYEKATFHSGTPPPFGAGSHLYIPAPPHHHHHHQMDARVNSSHNRRESGAAGRSSSSKPPPSKPAYSQSYWAPN
ncbi:protein lingerer isoform X2 [Amyelois transitella]|uniref:protein lingerer isoform X2 n=1 Tax=Amyelois transitella TaxID=680683 RepID=UPI00298F8E74|nr:protein lingerer isoform X2 [Amyelois transitella]